MNIKFPGFPIYSFFCLLLLASCGGEPVGDANRSTEGTNVSFRPLQVYYNDSQFYGVTATGFETYFYDGVVEAVLINPVDKQSGASLSGVLASDYLVTIDEVPIDPQESFPTLQRVIGEDIYLRTGLVFDLSGSTSQVDIAELIAEAKDYIAQVQNYSDVTIRDQFFDIWAFGDSVQSTGLLIPSADTTALETALDQVVALYNAQSLGPNSNLHRAVLESIGGLDDGTISYPANLFDSSTPDGIYMAQLVMFSSGPDTYLEHEPDLMVSGIQAQARINYAAGGFGETENLYKPVIYYVMGGSASGDRYELLAENAEVTRSVILNNGEYSFASTLIQDQLGAISRRINTDNQYVYRYAFIPRTGEHDIVFTSKNSDGSIFSLTGNLDIGATVTALGPTDPFLLLVPTVEIAGPNNEYIPNGDIKLSQASRFTPTTRWTTTTYGAGDYSWNLTGGTGTVNADGSYTVNSITGTSATLSLTNNVIADSATITILN